MLLMLRRVTAARLERRRLAAGSLLLGCLLQVAAAKAEPEAKATAPLDARQCITANEQAGTLRGDGKLIAAKIRYLACSAPECPAMVRDECQTLLDKTEASIPTVVVAAVDAQGHDVAGAQLFLDGATTGEPLDGRAIALDPGPHRIRVVAPDGTSVEQELVAREGEKNRNLSTIVEKPAAKPAPRANDQAQQAPRSSQPSALAWVLGGVAVVSLGSFAYFAVSGKQQENDLESRCAPDCAKSEVDDMYRNYLIADVSLGTAIVAAGAFGYLLLSDKGGEQRPAAASGKLELPLLVHVQPKAVALSYQTRFR
ncbi:MAG TPA: hypothetical protein VGP93_10855 [Polyangiaceae bacterium]|nr:hypothetical protein [Polyangiaceae bacterium]